MSDLVVPSAFTEKERKARKIHKCCECTHEITVGEKYQYVSGIWDGEPDSYKTCLSCATLRSDYTCKAGDELAFGELREGISNAFYKNYGAVEFLNDYPENKSEFKKLFSDIFSQKDLINETN